MDPITNVNMMFIGFLFLNGVHVGKCPTEATRPCVERKLLGKFHNDQTRTIMRCAGIFLGLKFFEKLI
jgi:hypothetical protein